MGLQIKSKKIRNKKNFRKVGKKDQIFTSTSNTMKVLDKKKCNIGEITYYNYDKKTIMPVITPC